MSSSLRPVDSGDGDGCTAGDEGEMALDGCDDVNEGELRMVSGMLVSEARRSSLAAPPMPFFCRNFSSQTELLPLRKFSAEDPVMVAVNRRAFSFSSSVVTVAPLFCALRTKLASAFSMSAPSVLPLDRLMGEWLRSSG